MANQYANHTLTEQVRQHGEMLARLTAIVEEDHKDLADLKKSTEVIAKAMVRSQEREALQAGFKTRFREWAIPVLAVLISVAATHFIH